MAIQHRRGNFADFDPYKMRPGEWAFPLDRGEGYYCITPGDVRRVATKEEIIEILETSEQAYDGLQQLLTELEDETVATGILNDIASLITKTNKNENDITKIKNSRIGTNMAINTDDIPQWVEFLSNRAHLSPSAIDNLEAGDKITLSAYLSNFNISNVALGIGFTDAGDAEIAFVQGGYVNSEGMYTFTTTIPANAVGGDIYAVQQHSSTVFNAFRIRNLKLEPGEIVTPWKPSVYKIPVLEYELNTHMAEIVKLSEFKISANQSIPHSASYQKVMLNLNSKNTDIATLENGSIKVLKSGLYKVEIFVSFAPSGTGQRQVVCLSRQILMNANSSGSPTRLSLSLSANLNVNDLITLNVTQTSGVALDIESASTFVNISRLGE